MEFSHPHSRLIFGRHTEGIYKDVKAAGYMCDSIFDLAEAVFKDELTIEKKSSDLNPSQWSGDISSTYALSIPGGPGQFIGDINVNYHLTDASVASVNVDGISRKSKFADIHGRITVNGDPRSIGFPIQLNDQLALEHANQLVSSLSEDKTIDEFNEVVSRSSTQAYSAGHTFPSIRRTNKYVDTKLECFLQDTPYFDGRHNNLGDVAFDELRPADPAADTTIANYLIYEKKNGHYKLPADINQKAQTGRKVAMHNIMSNDLLKTAQLLPNYQGTKLEFEETKKYPVGISNIGGVDAGHAIDSATWGTPAEPVAGYDWSYGVEVTAAKPFIVTYMIYQVRDMKIQQILDKNIGEGYSFLGTGMVARVQEYSTGDRDIGTELSLPGGAVTLLGAQVQGNNGFQKPLAADTTKVSQGNVHLPPKNGVVINSITAHGYTNTVGRPFGTRNLDPADSAYKSDQKKRRYDWLLQTYPSTRFGFEEYLTTQTVIIPVAAQTMDELPRDAEHQYVPTEMQKGVPFNISREQTSTRKC